MRHTRILAMALVAGVAVCTALQSVAVQRILALPEELAAYRTWRTLTKAPYEVTPDKWVQCVAPGNVESETARTSSGPHSQHLIQVYANRDAERALKSAQAKELPVGSVLAKEKILILEGSQPEFSGVAFMVKRSPDKFSETGGWEFRYFPSDENDRAQIQQVCSGCHKTAKRDYVFAEHLSKN